MLGKLWEMLGDDTSNPADSSQNTQKRVLTLFEQGNYEAILDILNDASINYSEKYEGDRAYELRIAYAKSYLYFFDVIRATSQCEAAIKLDNESTETLFLQAETLLMQKDFDAHIGLTHTVKKDALYPLITLLKSLEKREKQSAALQRLWSIFYNVNESYEQSLHAYEKFLEFNGNTYDALFVFCALAALAKAQRYNEVITLYHKTKYILENALKPHKYTNSAVQHSILKHRLLGASFALYSAYKARNDIQNAYTHLNDALSIIERYDIFAKRYRTPVYEEKLAHLLQKGLHDEAIEFYESTMQSTEFSQKSVIDIAHLYSSNEEYEKALNIYVTIENSVQTLLSEEMQQHIAQTFLDAKQYAEAAKRFMNLTQTYPETLKHYYKKVFEALAPIEQLEAQTIIDYYEHKVLLRKLELDTPSTLTVGGAYATLNDTAKASELFANALQEPFGMHPKDYYKIGVFYITQDIELALTCLKKAEKLGHKDVHMRSMIKELEVSVTRKAAIHEEAPKENENNIDDDISIEELIAQTIREKKNKTE